MNRIQLSGPKRLVLLIAAGAVVILGALAYLHLSFALSIGSGPAGPSVDRRPFERVWTTRPVLLVGLGDSVTAGFGARRGYNYFDLIASNPADDVSEMKGCCLSAVIPHMTVTNLAVSGSVSAELPDAQLPKVPIANPDTLGLVVITTGGNDLIHNYGRTPPREHAMYGATLAQAQPWIDGFAIRLDTIVTNVMAHFPGGCHVFMANIYDPSDGAGDIDHAGLPRWPEGLAVLAAYNQVINRCVQSHTNVHLVDFHSTFLGHGLHCGQFWSKHYDRKDPHYWYYSNLEDPNERGYDAVRRLFLNEMSKVAGQIR